jgi:hypothetical protein
MNVWERGDFEGDFRECMFDLPTLHTHTLHRIPTEPGGVFAPFPIPGPMSAMLRVGISGRGRENSTKFSDPFWWSFRASNFGRLQCQMS